MLSAESCANHRPSNRVCLRARLNFRAYPACSNPNSCFSWTGLCSWMVSILCGTTLLKSACCHACSGTSGQYGEAILYKSQMHDNQNGSWATQQCITEDHKRHTINNLMVPSVHSVVFYLPLELYWLRDPARRDNRKPDRKCAQITYV